MQRLDPFATTQQAEAAQQTESAVEEDAVTVDLAAGETLDLRDTKNVGEGAGQVSISNARTINNLTKAFSGALKTAGAKVKAHRTMESFNNSNEGVKNQNKAIAHIAVLVTLVCLVGLFMPLKGAIERGNDLAVGRVSAMIVSSLIALVFFIKSFIEARRK